MRRIDVFCFAASLCAVAGILLYVPKSAATQSDISQQAQDFANSILNSDAAQYLSGAGRSALNRLAHPELVSSLPGPSGTQPLPPFVSSRFEVMVNDPAQDTFTFSSDVSSQSETAVAAYGSNVVVAFNDSAEILRSLGHSVTGYSRSSDGGVTFTDLGFLPVKPGPAVHNEGDPGLVVDRAGNFYALSIVQDFSNLAPPNFSTVEVQKSTDGGQTFGIPVYVPSTGVLPGSLQDKNFIAVDATGGPNNGNLYVTWTSFPPRTVPFLQLPIFLSRSTDGGNTFSTPIRISALFTFNQGSEPAVGPRGELYVAWFQSSAFPPCAHCGPSIWVTKSTDGGLTFGPPIFVADAPHPGFASGNLLGNFRVNAFPRIDVNPLNGDVYIVYNANPPGPDGADIFFTRSASGGASWSSPLRVNDDPGTNDQFFPDVAVNSQGVIEVIWYDRRTDPNNLEMGVYRAQSLNGGLSFTPNQKVTNVTFAPADGYDPVIVPNYIGDYLDIKAGTGNSGSGRTPGFFLAWSDFRRIITTNGGTRPDQDVVFTTH